MRHITRFVLLFSFIFGNVIRFNPTHAAPPPHQPTNINHPAFRQIKKLIAETPQLSATIGASKGYALSGDIAVVGAGWETVGSNARQGSTYVYYRNFTSNTPDNWELVKKLTASDGTSDDYFGAAVAIAGDRIFVGAFRGGADGRGAVYVFERNTGGGNQWGQTKIITPTDAAAQAFGASLAAVGELVAVGAEETDVSGNDNQGAVYLYSHNQGGANNWGQIKKLTASDASAGAEFGYGLDMSNDLIAVGAPLADVGSNADQGQAYIFYRNIGGVDGWGEYKKVSAPDGAPGDKFAERVSLHDEVLAVSARFADIGNFQDQGAAYLYYRNQSGGNNWGFAKKLVASDGTSGDNFGFATINQDMVVVGSGGSDINSNPDQGAAYVFERNWGGADNWGQAQKLVASDGAAGDVLGRPTLVGNTLLLTAFGADVNGQSDAGAAYIFTLQGQRWTQVAKSVNPSELGGDYQGYMVAADGEFLLVGAPFFDNPVSSNTVITDAGMAHLYQRNQGGADGWQSVKVFSIPSAVAGDRFGQAVSLSDDTLVIGAPGRNSNNGAVYVYVRNSGGADNWGLAATINGAGAEQFGYALSLAGDLLAVGAPYNTGTNGAAYLYERNQGGLDLWGQVKAYGAPQDGSRYGYSVDLENNTLLVGAPYADVVATDGGAAYLYLRNQGGADAWQLLKSITTTVGANDHFGWTVSVADDTLAIGAPDNDWNGTDSGAAHIFARNYPGVDAWGRRKILTDTATLAGDRFGYAVDINIDTVAVGAPRAPLGGAVALFERNSTGADLWGQLQRFTANDNQANDRFGFAVALQSRLLMVGAATADFNAKADVGSAYVFRWQTQEVSLPFVRR